MDVSLIIDTSPPVLLGYHRVDAPTISTGRDSLLITANLHGSVHFYTVVSV